MIYSRSRRFIFVHNPKAAGTAIRAALRRYHDHEREFWGIARSAFWSRDLDFAHLRLWELPAEFPELFEDISRFSSAVVVRNPLSRFLSAVFEHYSQYRAGVGFAALPVERKADEIARLIHHEITPARVTGDFRYVHFSPQYWFFQIGSRRVVEHLVPMDRIGDLFAVLKLPPVPVQRRNAAPHDDRARLANAQVREFVAAFYKFDYEIFSSIDYLSHLAGDPDL